MLKKAAAFGIMIILIGMAGFAEPALAAKKADVLTGVTTGKRRVINHNIQQAKQSAVQDALEIAVQNAFSELVSREIFASNLDFFYNHILSRTSNYILAYRVLGGVESAGYYLVGVETKVDLARLERELTAARILNPNKDKPTIVFFIAEKTPDDLLPKYWWGKNPIPYQSVAENIIANRLIQDRYPVLGVGAERPDPSYYNVTFGSIYDIAAAKELGREMKADIIIFGKASASEAINRMGEEKAFDAVINLEAYHVETGEKAFVSRVEAVAKSEIPSEGIILALKNAADLSVSELEEKLGKYWVEQLRKEHAFEVKIEGPNFLPRFIALKQRFVQMPEIENMQPKEMGSDFALLQVFYKGKPDQFANAVMLKTFEAFGLEILDVSDTLITIRFIDKDKAPAFNDVQKDDGVSTMDGQTQDQAGEDTGQ